MKESIKLTFWISSSLICSNVACLFQLFMFNLICMPLCLGPITIYIKSSWIIWSLYSEVSNVLPKVDLDGEPCRPGEWVVQCMKTQKEKHISAGHIRWNQMKWQYGIVRMFLRWNKQVQAPVSAGISICFACVSEEVSISLAALVMLLCSWPWPLVPLWRGIQNEKSLQMVNKTILL